jgi:hypothetical protein
MKNVLRELLLGARNPPLGWLRVAAYTAIVFVLVAATTPSAFTVVVPHLASDGHAIVSLNVAVNGRSAARRRPHRRKTAERRSSDSSTNDQTVRQIVDALGLVRALLLDADPPVHEQRELVDAH